MANCRKCGISIGMFSKETMCEGCLADAAEISGGTKSLNPINFDQLKSNATPAQIVERQQRYVAAERNTEINKIMLTTETAPNLNITKRIEIVTAEVAYGMNIFIDLFASVRDVVGGRSEAVQATMRDARRTALYELKKEAHAVGANAVVGVDLDYVELSSSKSMVMLVASGTAVIVEE